DPTQHAMPTPDSTGLSRIWSEQAALFENPAHYNWDMIKHVWHQEWAKHEHFLSEQDNVFLEKSPPNVLRSHLLAEHFPGAWFLLMIRNPYAVVEGICRRDGYSLKRAVAHWVRVASRQQKNIAELPRSLFFSYEALCADPNAIANDIRIHVPGLEDLELGGRIASRTLNGEDKRPLENLNAQQIARLSADEIQQISTYLKPYRSLLEAFGYALFD
ncbi:MAG: sulfotransferase, partial [Pseudomonadota bacterium]